MFLDDSQFCYLFILQNADGFNTPEEFARELDEEIESFFYPEELEEYDREYSILVSVHDKEFGWKSVHEVLSNWPGTMIYTTKRWTEEQSRIVYTYLVPIIPR